MMMVFELMDKGESGKRGKRIIKSFRGREKKINSCKYIIYNIHLYILVKALLSLSPFPVSRSCYSAYPQPQSFYDQTHSKLYKLIIHYKVYILIYRFPCKLVTFTFYSPNLSHTNWEKQERALFFSRNKKKINKNEFLKF